MKDQLGGRGFTLVELLVTIGIIGVLVSILLPALGNARVAAKETLALSNVRQVGQVFSSYTNDFKAWPFRSKGVQPDRDGGPDVQLPNMPQVLFFNWWPEGVRIGISDHFAQEWLWPGIVSRVAPWPEHFKTWVSPGMSTELPEEAPIGGDRPLEAQISMRYSNAFVARPELFKAGAGAEEKLLAATKPDEVTYPSGKVLLWDAHLAYLRKRPSEVNGHFDALTPMAFADLHADRKNPTQASAGVVNPFRGAAHNLNTTADGVRGKDY